MTTKTQNQKPPPEPGPRPSDAAEVASLEGALAELDVSEQDDPTIQETHALRRAVVDASVALDDKQTEIREERVNRPPGRDG